MAEGHNAATSQENLTDAERGSEKLQGQVSQLKFAEEHIDPILRGQKTATIRLELDGSFEDYRTGRRLHLCDPDGERFATAVIHDRGYEMAKWLVHFGVEGHRDYADVEEFLNEMGEYYPDAELTPDTCFEIIYWEDYWE